MAVINPVMAGHGRFSKAHQGLSEKKQGEDGLRGLGDWGFIQVR